MTAPSNIGAMASTIWGTFELLRGRYQRHQFGQVILPFVVLRRLDCVLEPTKAAVLKAIKDHPDDEAGLYAQKAAKHAFWNRSNYTFETLGEDTANLRKNLINYVEGFSDNIQDVFTHYKIEETINELHRHGILLQVFQKFAAIDLHPEVFSNHDMADLFEKLISMDAESANLEAGEYFTPRDVIRLMINILITPDADVLTKDGVIRTVYDPTAGTGGMLSLAEEHILRLNPKAKISVFGQELNERTYSICKADMLVKGQDVDNIRQGDTLAQDHFADKKFDYCLANPPYGVEWKVSKEAVEREVARGFAGRFGAGLPRISDGQLLFLQHMVHHMKPVKPDGTGGGRVAVVFNGSPLFTGGAGSGESDIRGWLLKNDLLETIIALPNDIFFNTGISTYIWILTNRKSPARKGKVQLINAADLYAKMRKSLGSKRNELLDVHAAEVAKIYAGFKEGELCKIFANEDFSYREVVIERPLRQNYAASPERIVRLRETRALARLSDKQKDKLLSAIVSEAGEKTVTNRASFIAAIEKALDKADVGIRRASAGKLADELAEADPAGEAVVEDGKPVADKDLRDTEIVPSGQEIADYFEREVKPHVPDAWISEEMPRTGYEIPFTRHFYKYQPPRDLKDIDAEIRKLAREITDLLEDSAK
jgi:type I restriction enzyme M protein